MTQGRLCSSLLRSHTLQGRFIEIIVPFECSEVQRNTAQCKIMRAGVTAVVSFKLCFMGTQLGTKIIKQIMEMEGKTKLTTCNSCISTHVWSVAEILYNKIAIKHHHHASMEDVQFFPEKCHIHVVSSQWWLTYKILHWTCWMLLLHHKIIVQ